MKRSIASSQLAQVPAHRDQLLVGGVRDDRALNHDDAHRWIQLREPRAHGVFAMRRMREDAAA